MSEQFVQHNRARQKHFETSELWDGTHSARPFEMFLEVSKRNTQKVYSYCEGGASEEARDVLYCTVSVAKRSATKYQGVLEVLAIKYG